MVPQVSARRSGLTILNFLSALSDTHLDNKRDLVTELSKISSNLRCYICVIAFQYGPKEVPENKSASIGLLEVGKHLLDDI